MTAPTVKVEHPLRRSPRQSRGARAGLAVSDSMSWTPSDVRPSGPQAQPRCSASGRWESLGRSVRLLCDARAEVASKARRARERLIRTYDSPQTLEPPCDPENLWRRTFRSAGFGHVLGGSGKASRGWPAIAVRRHRPPGFLEDASITRRPGYLRGNTWRSRPPQGAWPVAGGHVATESSVGSLRRSAKDGYVP